MTDAKKKVVKKSSAKNRRNKTAPKEKRERFVIECSDPVTDGIMDTASLEK